MRSAKQKTFRQERSLNKSNADKDCEEFTEKSGR